MSVSQCRSPQKPRLLQSHDVPGLRLLCVERPPLSTRLVSHKIQSQRKVCFRSGIIYHQSSQTFTSLYHFHQGRKPLESTGSFLLVSFLRRGTSSNRAITTSRGLPAYLGTKYPGTFLNFQLPTSREPRTFTSSPPSCLHQNDNPSHSPARTRVKQLCLPLLFGRGLISSTEPGRYQANHISLLTSAVSHIQARICCAIHFLIGRDPSCPPQLSHQHPSRRILLPGILDHRSCRHGFVTQT